MIDLKSLGVITLAGALFAACSSHQTTATDGGAGGTGSGGKPPVITPVAHVDAGAPYTETVCPGSQLIPGITDNFPLCNDICGAPSHCTPIGLTMGEENLLPNCPNDGNGKVGRCVPDPIAATLGKFIFKKCDFVLGNTVGRCVPVCIANHVSTFAQGLVPGAPCGASEVCAPCINPTDDTNTHACDDYCPASSAPSDAGPDGASSTGGASGTSDAGARDASSE